MTSNARGAASAFSRIRARNFGVPSKSPKMRAVVEAIGLNDYA